MFCFFPFKIQSFPLNTNYIFLILPYKKQRGLVSTKLCRNLVCFLLISKYISIVLYRFSIFVIERPIVALVSLFKRWLMSCRCSALCCLCWLLWQLACIYYVLSLAFFLECACVPTVTTVCVFALWQVFSNCACIMSGDDGHCSCNYSWP